MDDDLYADPLHAQRPDTKDRPPRPHRYLYLPRRSQYILLSLAIVLVLGIISVAFFMHQSSIRTQSNPNIHLAKIHTPIPTTHATTPNSSTQAPTPTATTTQASSTHSPAPTATQASSTQVPTPMPVPPFSGLPHHRSLTRSRILV